MVEAITDGIVVGLGFGLLGVGLTLVYGLAGVLNLAYGELAIIAALVSAELVNGGMATVPAAAIGVASAAGAGVAMDLTVMQAVYRQKGEHRTLLGLLLTLGMAFLIEGFLNWRDPLGGFYILIIGKPVTFAGAILTKAAIEASLIAIGVAVILLAFFNLSTLGRGVRSVIQDETGARLVGISPRLTRTIIFGLSGALAGLVAVTSAMQAPVTVTGGFSLTINALIVTVVGGLGSVAGAFLAGILLGIVDQVSAVYIGQYITSIVLLGAAALTILIRPRGLLGR